MITEDYTRQNLALLPPGDALPPEAPNLEALFTAIADELARVDARNLDLIEEADPRTTSELLADWERVAGLPDPCLDNPPTTTAERRLALAAHLASEGKQDEQFFIDLADALGYTVTITYPLAHQFQINGPTTTIRTLTCIGTCSESLRIWGNAELECAINGKKPAHVQALFAYA